MQRPSDKRESADATERPDAEASARARDNGGSPADAPTSPNVANDLLQAAQLPRPDEGRPAPSGGTGGPTQTPQAAGEVATSVADADDVVIGPEIDAVLKAAEASAQRIRANAERDAEAIRADAHDGARQLLADAQREGQALRAELHELRREVDAYGKRVRADAEAYAAETRKAADEEATSKSSEAEHVLRSARREAAKILRDATGDAQRRKASLELEGARFEERFANILTIFHDMSSQLEAVLRERVKPRDQVTGSVSENESLADQLKDAATEKRDEAEDASGDEAESGTRGKPGRSGRSR